jgi:hypothetical protein
MQLLLYVVFRPDRADVLEIAGARPEREPVEHVEDSVLLGCFESHDRLLALM